MPSAAKPKASSVSEFAPEEAKALLAAVNAAAAAARTMARAAKDAGADAAAIDAALAEAVELFSKSLARSSSFRSHL